MIDILALLLLGLYLLCTNDRPSSRRGGRGW